MAQLGSQARYITEFPFANHTWVNGTCNVMLRSKQTAKPSGASGTEQVCNEGRYNNCCTILALLEGIVLVTNWITPIDLAQRKTLWHLFTCTVRCDGTKLDSKRIPRLLEVEKCVIVASGAIKISSTTQHFAICQVHPEVSLEFAHLTPPTTSTEV